MRSLFVLPFLLLFSYAAEAQMQLANPINVKRYNNNRLKKKSKQKKAIYDQFMPFDLRGGLIFLTAHMTGQPDSFVLDTGAPALLLNKKVHRDSSNSLASDITGDLHLQNVMVPEFRIGTVKAERVNAYCLDLSHLEKNKQHKIAGMIGYEQVKDHELFLDYDKKQMLLMDPERSIYPDEIEPHGFIPFTMQKHFVVIVAKVGGKKLRFGIDTGAEVNLMSSRTFEKLSGKIDFKKEDSIKIRGVKEDALSTQQITIPKTIVKKKNYADMLYVVMDMDPINNVYGVKLDGILGYPFLASQKFSINYTDQKMYIWKDVLPERKASEEDVLAVGVEEQK